ncbi:MAG: MBL fold metallo-hydrolase [Propionibacteriaceae bacterium]|jgi:L-ascorbate metabolism protein UlaG (beta-lactamase superfamily)|nr:MBL fold metallo-hydrolase [Propionibacteriaceae bacterium]
MIITHLGHSAVLVEAADRRLLIDPGNFSSAWHDLRDLDAVVVTHQHPDHADPVHLPGLLAANPQALVLVEPSLPEVMDLPQARRLAVGDRVDLGSLHLQAVGGQHAVIHRDIPRIGNVGVVIEGPGQPRFFHPGDALDTVPPGVDLVALPAHGPWCAMKEIIDFARQLGAERGFLIHDGLLNQRGWSLSFDRLGQMTGTGLVDLRDGQPWTVG